MKKYLINEIQLKEIIEAGRNASKDKSEEALNVGSQVHHLIERHIKGENLEEGSLDNMQVSSAYSAFLEWESENIDKWICTEQTVYDNDMKVAGTMDAGANMKSGGFYIIDFKTSKGFYEDYPIQIAAYRKMFEQTHGLIPDGMGILRLDKETGTPYWKDYSKDYERFLQVFQHLANAWWLMKTRRLKYSGAVMEGEYHVSNDKE